jgi:hypothetical protein
MDTLLSILEKNPHKTETLAPIEIKLRSDTQDGENVPKTLCGWIPTPLEPPGPLAAALWKTNPEFRAGTPPVKRTILRETILKMLERIDSELKGQKWSKKKVIEQLNMQQSADVSPPQDTKELDVALAHLYEVQLVIIDEANKKIRWVPDDIRQWTPTRPVWGLSLGSRAMFHNVNETPVGDHLSQWLSDRETEGWKIHWPIAEGTLEEIKLRMLNTNAGIGSRIEKPKKADYAAALGKAEAIQHFLKHFSGVQQQTDVIIS